MALETYRKKRDFGRTAEPSGHVASEGSARHFVVQEHHASRLHFDLRLEMEGVLKSWAVPKGPSFDPGVRRLAVMTEDHPLEYLTFAGHIPEGNYGAGDMAVWDTGTYTTEEEDPVAGVVAGKLVITFSGEKLKGEFHLFRTKAEENQWLLVKGKDEYADPDWVLETVIEETQAQSKAAKTRKSTAAHKKAEVPEAPAPRRAARAKSPATSTAKTPREPKPATPEAEWRPPAGAVQAPFPAAQKPMLATLVEAPPPGDDWVYEVKWDGYRALGFVEGDTVRLISRTGNDMTPMFAPIADALRELRLPAALLDGEIVALDDEGAPRFQLLQNATGIRSSARRKAGPAGLPPANLMFYAFDLLHYAGYDLTGCALRDRKAVLQSLLAKTPAASRARFSEHFEGAEAARQLLQQARELGLEGVVAKRGESQYVPRRSESWLKIKLHQEMDAVVGGYTAPRGSRSHLGALVLGVYDGDRFEYVGHTGTGMDEDDLRNLFERLQPLATPNCPFSIKPATNAKAHWVKPELVCQVRFGERTADHHLRHPVFLGLRFDKAPRDCHWDDQGPTAPPEKPETAELASTADKAEVSEPQAPEKPKRGPTATKSATTRRAASESGKAGTKVKPVVPALRGAATAKTSGAVPVETLLEPGLKGSLTVQAGEHKVALTHLDKVYWPKAGFTKGDLLRYYFQVHETILPYLADRPLILKRYPGGIEAPFFFQHNAEGLPEFVHTVRVPNNDAGVVMATCQNLASLLTIVNLGTITQNPYLSRVEHLDRPDWLVFDLDPGEKVAFAAVRELALEVNRVLTQLGLKAYAKTSGATGIHLYLPLEPVYTYEQARDFGTVVAEIVTRRRPDLSTLERSLAARPHDRIYLDTLQNVEGKSVAGPWSARAKPAASVSTAVTFAEIQKGVEPGDFTIDNVPARLKKYGDGFRPVLDAPGRLEEAVELLQELVEKEPVPVPRRRKKT